MNALEVLQAIRAHVRDFGVTGQNSQFGPLAVCPRGIAAHFTHESPFEDTTPGSVREQVLYALDSAVPEDFVAGSSYSIGEQGYLVESYWHSLKHRPRDEQVAFVDTAIRRLEEAPTSVVKPGRDELTTLVLERVELAGDDRDRTVQIASELLQSLSA